jgi:hypothetical protein
MIKKVAIFVVALGIFLPATLMAQDYNHSLEAEDMTVSWAVDGDKIHFKLSAPTTGWVAIGFDPENAMKGGDIAIGAVKNGKVRIEDHFGDRKRGHSPDDRLGGGNNIMAPQGMEENKVTTISFTRALAAGDEYDKAIETDTVYRIMVAYGSGRDSFRAGHQYRGVYDVNFTTGESKKIK